MLWLSKIWWNDHFVVIQMAMGWFLQQFAHHSSDIVTCDKLSAITRLNTDLMENVISVRFEIWVK